MKSRLIAAITVLTILLGGHAICQEGKDKPEPAPASQPADESPKNVWMKMKLKYGQNIYTSIAQADVDAIAFDAKRLKALNWFEGIAHSKDANYQEQMKFFEAANDKLINEAERKNLDGCTLAFMQMTFSCTACHQKLRESSQPKKPAQAP